MLQEVIDLQKNAVNKILYKLQTKDEITFRAPTGSGKTYMMADLMNQILSDSNDVVFLVSSLSKGSLAIQNYEKFNEYKRKGEFLNLDPYLINTEISSEERLYIPTEHNVYLLPRDLYKKGGKLMQGAMENFLQTLTLNNFFGGLNKKVYLIKDECHIATSNLDDIKDMVFSKIINFSATPNLKRGQNPDVEITDKEAVEAKLIKHIELGNEEDSIANALQKFEEIKDGYRNLLGVNPCLIIQISNKDKADYELNNLILPELKKTAHQDLKWMLIVDKEKDCDTNDVFKAKKLPVEKWKSYAKENTSTIDVIIFKMVISEGWDIPRACMLYQVRDTQSKQLDEQVIGRVRRNPRLLDFELLNSEAQNLATTAWIWGIMPKNQKKIFNVKLFDKIQTENSIKIKTTKLKELTNKTDFNLKEFIEKQNKIEAYMNIFSMYRKLNSMDSSIKKLCYEYSTDYKKWWSFISNIDKIAQENNKFICDYSQSMLLSTDESGNERNVSLPEISSYVDNGNYINISNWVWKRQDGKDKFSFDSDAEREWANILKDLSAIINKNNMNTIESFNINNKTNSNISLFDDVNPINASATQKFFWGKNYLPNSEVKYEYYLNGIHTSFPDFIMLDSFGRVHIFEIKSINQSNDMPLGFDKENYDQKINELKKCYKVASKLTKHIFYLPLLKEDTWYIAQFINGDEKSLTKEQFLDFVVSQ